MKRRHKATKRIRKKKSKVKPFLCSYCDENDEFTVDEYGHIYCKNCGRVLGNDTRIEQLINK